MAILLLSRSFRLEEIGSNSWRKVAGRSNSSLVESEFANSEVARITAAYDRLSHSTRLFPNNGFSHDDEDDGNKEQFHHNNRRRYWKTVSKVFSTSSAKKMERESNTMGYVADRVEKEKKKIRSKWLPDPTRRWPVQGW